MTSTTARRTARSGSARFGYGVAAGINVLILLGINGWPGWEAVPFLTAETTQVLGLINLSLLAGIVANLVYLAVTRPWVRPLGDLVTTGIGLAAMIRILQVFPFALSTSPFDWALLFRVGLIVGIVGASIGIVVQLVMLVRALLGLPTATQDR